MRRTLARASDAAKMIDTHRSTRMRFDAGQPRATAPSSDDAQNRKTGQSGGPAPVARQLPPTQVVPPKPATSWAERFHVMQGVLPIDPARVSMDIAAGMTLAALGIPEVMGYTSIAGMPVITGLYTILMPIAVFALLGSSRHLVVGADSATAAILAAGLVLLAAPESPALVDAGGTGGPDHCWLARPRTRHRPRVPGGLPLALGACRLSHGRRHPGRVGTGRRHVRRAWGRKRHDRQALTALSQSPQANLPTLIVSVSVLVVSVGLQPDCQTIPGPLLAVVGSIVVS